MNPLLAAQIAIVAVGAVLLLIAVRRAGRLLRTSGTSAFDEAMASRTSPGPALDEVVSIQQALDAARASAFGLHFGLRPMLRRVAAGRLAVRHGVDLELDPSAAARLLGDGAYAAITDDAARSARPRGPGMDLDSMERIISALESL